MKRLKSCEWDWYDRKKLPVYVCLLLLKIKDKMKNQYDAVGNLKSLFIPSCKKPDARESFFPKHQLEFKYEFLMEKKEES